MSSYLLKTTKKFGTPVFVTQGDAFRLQRVFGAVKSKEDGLWYFPAYHPAHTIVLNDFAALGIKLEQSDAVVEHVRRLNHVPEFITKKILPKHFVFKTQPYDHQLEGLIHLIYFWRAALFYACGLGKTKIIIDWQRAVKCWPLILCPKNVLSVWMKEPRIHGIDQEYRIIDATVKAEKQHQIQDAANYQGMAVTYETMWRHYEQIADQVPYDALVADESHKIKNHQSKRTQAALVLAGKARRRVIMSGTASMGDPRDLYPQFRFLGTCFMAESFWKFKHTFCVTSPNNKHIVTGYQNLHVLRQRVNLLALHKKKEDCLSLPDRLIIDLSVSLAPKQQRIYNTLLLSDAFKELTQALLRDEKLLTGRGIVDIPNAAILINKLIQVCCGFLYVKPDMPDICRWCDTGVRNCILQNIKPYTSRCTVDQGPLKPLVEYTPDNAKCEVLQSKLEEILIDPDNKVIIWGQYRPELDLIEKVLTALWLDKSMWTTEDTAYHVRVDGATRNNPKSVDLFNTDVNCRVYLGQVETGEGITLNAANYMIYYSLPWKLGAYEQSLDRNYRVGQRRSSIVFRLLGHQTVDQNVASALECKGTINDILLTTLLCNVCPSYKACKREGTQLFSAKCIHPRSIDRPITRL